MAGDWLRRQLRDRRVQSALTGVFELYFFAHVGGAFINVEHVLRREKYFEAEVLAKLNVSSSSVLNSTATEAFNAGLSQQYILLNEVKNIAASLLKMLVSLLIDVSGYWLARFFCHGVVFSSLLAIIFSSASRSWLVWVGYPFYYGANTAIMLIHITLLSLFPNHQGKYISAFKICYVIEPLFYNWYKDAGETQRLWFWVFFLGIQPLMWLRTLTMLPKYQADTSDLKNVRLGWVTRHDKRSEAVTVKNTEDRSDLEDSFLKKSDDSMLDKNQTAGPCPTIFSSIWTYVVDLFKSLTLKNVLLTFWVNLEILIGMSIYGQYYSYLAWKLPYSEKKYDVYIKKYLSCYNYSYVIMLVSLPIIGSVQDAAAKAFSSRTGRGILAGQTFSMLCLMLLISGNSMMIHFLFSSSTIDPVTLDFAQPWIPVFCMACVIVWVSHLWTVRNVYIVSNNNSHDQQKLLFVNNFLQALMHVVTAKMGQWVADWFLGDWDVFFYWMGWSSLVSLLIPGLMWVLHFVRQ